VTLELDRLVLIVTVGVPGSGKSTWARATIRSRPPGQIVRVNCDSLRQMMHDSRYDEAATEPLIVLARDSLIRLALSRHVSVLVDDTNIDPSIEPHLRSLAFEYDAAFHVQFFASVPIDLCIERDALRPPDRSVGADVIRRAAAALAARGLPKSSGGLCPGSPAPSAGANTDQE
jgi:predicted kinase